MTQRVLLLFPGVTEARFFPYLSLPLLTAYLRERGIECAQRDLNIGLTHRLPAAWAAHASDDDQRTEFGDQLRQLIRAEGDTVMDVAFDGTWSEAFPWPVADRLVRNTIDEALRGSALVRPAPSLAALVDAAVVRAGDDLALRRLGCAPDEVVFVGDSYEADYLGPRSLGMHAILIDPLQTYPIDGADRLATLLDLHDRLA